MIRGNVMKHRLLSIDPGTVNLGVAISDITTGVGMKVLDASNLQLKKVLTDERIREVTRKFAIREIIRDYLYKTLVYWQPSAVISEVPYLNESLNSFLSLYECNLATREAIQMYSATMAFHGVDPASAKKALGIPGNSGDKALVFEQVTNSEHIDLSLVIPKQMSEHAIDAILIGNYYYKHFEEWRIK